MILKKQKQRNKPIRTEQVLRLPYPPTANNLFANGAAKGRYKTKKYKDWIEKAGWTLREQRPVEMTGLVEVEIIATRPDKRKRDLGNLEKAILDLLVIHRVIEDDSCLQCLCLSWATNDLAPGVSVTINSFDPELNMRHSEKQERRKRERDAKR